MWLLLTSTATAYQMLSSSPLKPVETSSTLIRVATSMVGLSAMVTHHEVQSVTCALHTLSALLCLQNSANFAPVAKSELSRWMVHRFGDGITTRSSCAALAQQADIGPCINRQTPAPSAQSVDTLALVQVSAASAKQIESRT